MGLPDRLALTDLPTPLHELPRFSEAVGARVLMKRDDVGGPGVAGNKVRKLERTLAAAREEGVDAVVTVGAAQSNHARATAAACARLGWRCRLVLGVPDGDGTAPEGNVLLDALFGAEVVVAAGTTDWAALAERAEAEAAALRDEGCAPLVLPAGGSTPLGATGFAAAYAELLDQLDARGLEPVEVLHASSTGGTHGGLVAGRELAGRGPAVRGVLVVDGMGGVIGELHAWLAREAFTVAGGAPELALAPDDLDLEEGFLGEGYGVPTAEGLDAIRLLARTEAIVCDPVYTGKALACLVARARAGAYAGGPVVFWHTGGWPAVFTAEHAAALT
ncbi:pyridoxal-phosphate dependent enzyme [Conexibacter sp. SYSU D00693]|uniref:pyridoxal-phosphate dependent enzyme n=1 Tax=Conexibacter sp. SYSU D00693 TaxID=2812560 RepID=UPI00196A9ABC|nr:pyridoxal-phosphate dependent enzyme [Conexibacter sp. SYSU D00693]